MEDIVPVLIFIAIILGSFIKKLIAKKSPKQDKTAADTGWVAKLNAYLDNVKKRIEEQQPREAPTSADQWRQLMGKDAPSRSDQMAMDELIYSDEDDLSDLPVETPSMPASKTQTGSSSQPPAAPVTPYSIQEKRLGPKQPFGLPRGAAGLRKAIVWAEIIGPPVGLRQPNENRF